MEEGTRHLDRTTELQHVLCRLTPEQRGMVEHLLAFDTTPERAYACSAFYIADNLGG